MTAKGLNPIPKAFAVCIDGVIPPAAGVSSSSAFVVASALATLRLHGVDLAKKELAAMCTTCEYAPMGGGGLKHLRVLAENVLYQFCMNMRSNLDVILLLVADVISGRWVEEWTKQSAALRNKTRLRTSHSTL